MSEVLKPKFFSANTSPVNWSMDQAVFMNKVGSPGMARGMMIISSLYGPVSSVKNLTCLVTKIAVSIFALTIGQIPTVKQRTWSTLESLALVSSTVKLTLLSLVLHVYKFVMFMTFSPICCLTLGMVSPEKCKAVHDWLKLTSANKIQQAQQSEATSILSTIPATANTSTSNNSTSLVPTTSTNTVTPNTNTVTPQNKAGENYNHTQGKDATPPAPPSAIEIELSKYTPPTPPPIAGLPPSNLKKEEASSKSGHVSQLSLPDAIIANKSAVVTKEQPEKIKQIDVKCEQVKQKGIESDKVQVNSFVNENPAVKNAIFSASDESSDEESEGDFGSDDDGQYVPYVKVKRHSRKVSATKAEPSSATLPPTAGAAKSSNQLPFVSSSQSTQTLTKATANSTATTGASGQSVAVQASAASGSQPTQNKSGTGTLPPTAGTAKAASSPAPGAIGSQQAQNNTIKTPPSNETSPPPAGGAKKKKKKSGKRAREQRKKQEAKKLAVENAAKQGNQPAQTSTVSQPAQTQTPPPATPKKQAVVVSTVSAEARAKMEAAKKANEESTGNQSSSASAQTPPSAAPKKQTVVVSTVSPEARAKMEDAKKANEESSESSLEEDLVIKGLGPRGTIGRQQAKQFLEQKGKLTPKLRKAFAKYDDEDGN